MARCYGWPCGPCQAPFTQSNTAHRCQDTPWDGAGCLRWGKGSGWGTRQLLRDVASGHSLSCRTAVSGTHSWAGWGSRAGTHHCLGERLGASGPPLSRMESQPCALPPAAGKGSLSSLPEQPNATAGCAACPELPSPCQ